MHSTQKMLWSWVFFQFFSIGYKIVLFPFPVNLLTNVERGSGSWKNVLKAGK